MNAKEGARLATVGRHGRVLVATARYLLAAKTKSVAAAV